MHKIFMLAARQTEAAVAQTPPTARARRREAEAGESSLRALSIPRSWPSAAARLPAAAASCSKSIDPLLRHEVEKVSIDLAALAIKLPSEPQLTTSGRATSQFRFPLTKSQQNVTGCCSELAVA